VGTEHVTFRYGASICLRDVRRPTLFMLDYGATLVDIWLTSLIFHLSSLITHFSSLKQMMRGEEKITKQEMSVVRRIRATQDRNSRSL
jgi:hypothetical protein